MLGASQPANELMNEPSLVHARYEAGPLLGQGAQGFVLRVFDREARARPLVAKVWRSASFDPALLAAEFSLLSRLDIRGLVRAHDWGRDEQSGAPFLIEDFVAGVCARDFVQRDENGRQQRLATVLVEVAATLSALHDAAFLHGDLKPDHVRVTADQSVLVLDLGCALDAERRGAGATGFTPAFAAPEVRAGARPGRGSDLFSLGALCWYLATGSPPPTGRAKLRSQAPWVPPSLGDVIESLLELHPRDRPASADELLRRLGQQQLASSRRTAPAPIGRERELGALSEALLGVRYVVGASGSGKSHLLREVVTRALVLGRPARRVGFPNDDTGLLSKLLAFLRGADVAWPFQERGSQEAPLLLVLDDFHAAPAELTSALEAYRCRAPSTDWLDVVAAVREAPPSAPLLELRPLNERSFKELCAALGIRDPARTAQLAELSGGFPGWVVAAQGRVPLTRDMVLERAKSLSTSASELLAALALLGSRVSQSLLERVTRSPMTCPPPELAELLEAGLVARRAHGAGLGYALQVPELAVEIAAALGSFEIAERLTQVLLGCEGATARLLLNLAGGPFPPSQRQSLLARAVELARQNGCASDEMEGLFALAAEPSQRSAERLRRLERLTRHAGDAHPRVLAWLSEAAVEQPALLPLARRRAAEQAARSGDMAQARELSEQAEAAAARLAEPEALALCIATRGALALYRADVDEADRALRDAAARLALLDEVDPEERARLEHNLGVVSLYRDSIEDAIRAFECSLAIKRRLGDRAGVRSCLLNLGLALARHGSHEQAERALDEAIALARSLGQQAGRAWCLAARADLEIRRGNAAAAERYVAEASSIAETPPLVAADLCILRGQAALLDGDGVAARRALSLLDGAARSSDAMLDAKAKLVEAGVLLASLPAEPRRAARLAVSVLRAARIAKLPEIEAQARQLLRAARGWRARASATRYPAAMDGDAQLWALLGRVASARDGEQAPLELLRTARKMSGAERALLAVCNSDAVVTSAWGVDFDGFALAEAGARCDADFLRRAFEARSPLYQRDVETDAGRGARVAVPSFGEDGKVTILLLEQRFRTGAFDGLSDALLARLATLSAIATRLAASERSEDVVASPALAHRAANQAQAVPTTALPALRARRSFPGIVGTSRPLEMALAKLDGAVDSELPVLIHGETGTGKELFARALHEHGARRRAPLVVINCAAVPDSLFEAELFGHARGAFTGADRARPGLIARAEGGTLFLDEIGELPLTRQASLLRVLESRRYRAVGSDEERPFDVRIVCATNRDLEAEVERGKFRRDLLFRINVVEIRVPALRERRADIPALVQAFLVRSGATLSVAAAAMSALEAHEWLGNVRELEHHMQRLALLGVERIERAHLPRALRQAVSELPERPALDERAQVELALVQARGNITHAARALGLTRHGLKKRMLRLGLRARAEGEGA
jgi:DNA-binding NtrC family response regulator/tRNA A-37 threonylcarbamoyl transferase component Bud32/tetratricopeptide (TPR) repeat protein